MSGSENLIVHFIVQFINFIEKKGLFQGPNSKQNDTPVPALVRCYRTLPCRPAAPLQPKYRGTLIDCWSIDVLFTKDLNR